MTGEGAKEIAEGTGGVTWCPSDGHRGGGIWKRA